jgi:uncharacterized protein involved in response to NO
MPPTPSPGIGPATMAELLRIEEPAGTRPAAPQWAAFMSLGFRPLYLAGCAWAALSVALWVFAPGWLAGALPGVSWHAHEMLWGFIATIAVGFLLTAGHNWTGVNPLHGPALGGLLALWLLARIGLLLPGTVALRLATMGELLFFAGAELALARAVYGTRNRRNYGVPLLVLALGGADALFLRAALRGDHGLALQYFHTGMLCMAVLTLLIARRVIPFFASRAIPGLVLPMHARSGHGQLAAGVLALGAGLAGQPVAMAALLALAGAIALVQWWTWKPWATRHVPLLWILYAGYAALGIGLLVAAAHAAGWVLRMAWPAHVIGVAGFAVLIMGMVTRTALGHLGRPLHADGPIVACYGLVLAAAALRLLALAPGPWTVATLHAASVAWVLAFALYLWRFVPWLFRPRADQPTGRPVTIPVRRPGGR